MKDDILLTILVLAQITLYGFIVAVIAQGLISWMTPWMK